jgi:hypothetical protein
MHNSKLLAIILTIMSISLIVGCKKTDVPPDNDIPANIVPVANAGISSTITLPADSASLSGSGTDADGSVVAYLWSQVSGPAASVIVNPGSPSTKVKGLKQGSYIFQLMVTDNQGATGVDTCMVIVNPAVNHTLSLQPSNNPNEVTLVNNNGTDASGAGRPDMPVEAWTSGGNPYTTREILKFDLSSIPQNATIVSANFYLYSYPSPTSNGNLTDANFGTANAMTVQQVTSSWTPGSITWFSQPSTTTTNQVIAPQTSQSVLDLNLDITGMVASMVNSNSNYGFLLKLQSETTYNSRIFVSSNNTSYTTKYPKLVIIYQ